MYGPVNCYLDTRWTWRSRLSREAVPAEAALRAFRSWRPRHTNLSLEKYNLHLAGDLKKISFLTKKITRNCVLKGLSHEMDLAFDDIYDMVSFGAPVIL
jgi:hypothetical protein